MNVKYCIPRHIGFVAYTGGGGVVLCIMGLLEELIKTEPPSWLVPPEQNTADCRPLATARRIHDVFLAI